MYAQNSPNLALIKETPGNAITQTTELLAARTLTHTLFLCLSLSEAVSALLVRRRRRRSGGDLFGGAVRQVILKLGGPVRRWLHCSGATDLTLTPTCPYI